MINSSESVAHLTLGLTTLFESSLLTCLIQVGNTNGQSCPFQRGTAAIPPNGRGA